MTKDGHLLPARVVRGVRRFEEVRGNKGPWTLLYSPRLAPRAEDGPVLLEIYDMTAEAGTGNGSKNAP